MISPEEVVARRVLPTARAMVAERLKAHGLTERQIAGALGLTQSAVSKYLRGRIRREPLVEGAAAFVEAADRLAWRAAKGGVSSGLAMAELHAAVRREEDRGVVCRLHEEDAPELRGQGCDLCVRHGGSDRAADQEALADVRVALQALEAEPAFARLIPSVGSNVARGKPGATRGLEVAAVPGRIFEMRGAVRVPAPPEFGASRHVAEVVLAAMSVFPEVAAAVNVRADEATLARAKALGWTLVEFEAAYEGRHERIAKQLRGRRKPPRALFHAGAFGIEPIMYVLGDTAAEAVAEAIVLARSD